MPHVSSNGGGDDLGSEDEVKVFKDEGEDEKRSSENLTEEKSSLIDLTESEEKVSLAGGSYATTGKTSTRSDLSPVFGKVDPTPHTSSFNMGYLVSPYPYPNGAGGPIPVSMDLCQRWNSSVAMPRPHRVHHSRVESFFTERRHRGASRS
ncbi:protein pangolin, isoforms A/H/I/S-like [Hylaeus anthracinus]|uniref:protein pangolin, isoforms A/H/I/S-like n=1 Tax=Hylaeus anthracinus TaxID=313031 RepID=UPI0023B9D1A9|nr:protein pangolin, isoforms A/H/I/S-like [Hylaeus anthracinus]